MTTGSQPRQKTSGSTPSLGYPSLARTARTP
nr:MAG TPA: hypothetical protein [Caudoviricetes sp.]